MAGTQRNQIEEEGHMNMWIDCPQGWEKLLKAAERQLITRTIRKHAFRIGQQCQADIKIIFIEHTIYQRTKRINSYTNIHLIIIVTGDLKSKSKVNNLC